MVRVSYGLLLALMSVSAAPAQASEIFGGIYAHEVDTPFTVGSSEDGLDLQLGWRGDRLDALRFIGRPSPHVFASLATSADTHFVAAGIGWRIGGRLYVRPGVGLAVHTRGSDGVSNGVRTDLGSRIVFAPEIGLGYRVSDRLSVEASWVHLSHAQLFSRQNPGLDSIGVRLSYALR